VITGRKSVEMKRLNNEFPHTHQGCHKVLKYVALFLGVGGCKKLKIPLNIQPEEPAEVIK